MASQEPGQVGGLLLDVEGTTTPLAFVHDELFPYARRRLRDFLDREWDGLRADLEALQNEYEADRRLAPSVPRLELDSALRSAGVVAYLEWLMDQDRKSPTLKSLQGKIWEEGYRAGELRGRVYVDVSPALERWHRQGRRIAIFSSGSVLAQRLLFSKSDRGDLTPWIDAYFDTSIGAKVDPLSYAKIAGALRLPSERILFISDSDAELRAAQHARMGVALCVRSLGTPHTEDYPVVTTFEAVCP